MLKLILASVEKASVVRYDKIELLLLCYGLFCECVSRKCSL